MNSRLPGTEPWLPEIAAFFAPPERKPTVTETWVAQNERQQLATAWLERWEQSASLTSTGRPIDGLLLPTTPIPAKPHGGVYPYNGYAMCESF
jgi:amidase